MDRNKIIIAVGVIILLAIVFFAWQFFTRSNSSNESNYTKNEAVTEQDVPKAISALEISDDTTTVLGETISLDKNRVDEVINDNTFWAAPIGGSKNMVVTYDGDTKINKGDTISIVGVVENLKDYSDESASWKLTKEDIEILSKNPIIVKASKVTVVN